MQNMSTNRLDIAVHFLIGLVALLSVIATIVFVPERLWSEDLALVERIVLRLPELLLILFTAVTATIAWRTHRENQKSTLLKLYSDVVEKHHSADVTQLRRDGYEALTGSCQAAHEEGVPLREYDSEAQLKVSRLANYYESLGMLYEASWPLLPKSTRWVLVEMVHNSVSRFWPLYCKYIDTIRPEEGRAADYAGSFEWLYNQVQDFEPSVTKFDAAYVEPDDESSDDVDSRS